MPRISSMNGRACPFASHSVAEHLMRGAGAAILIALTVWLVHVPGPLHKAGAVAAVAGAVVLMRGCPTCWLTGLFATLAARSRQRVAEMETERAPDVALRSSLAAPR